MKKVRIQIPASTTNLGPGFDCLGLALTLYNLVELEYITGSHRLKVKGEGAGELADPHSNWVMKGIGHFFQRIGEPVPGISLKLENQIPFSRGLGSSAAAYLGGLASANYLSGKVLSLPEIMGMAVEHEGHPDNVVPAMVGGLTIACTTENGTFWVKCEHANIPTVLVVIPSLPMGTKESRAALPKQVPLQDAAYNLARTGLLVAALMEGKWDLLQEAMRDRLHQPYRDTKDHLFSRCIQSALDSGALGAAISGSGSTVLAFLSKEDSQISRAMESVFLEKQIPVRSIFLKVDTRGLTQLE